MNNYANLLRTKDNGICI